MDNMIRVKITIRTNKVGSESKTEMEFDAADWNSMTNSEREEVCREAAFEMIEWNFEEVA